MMFLSVSGNVQFQVSMVSRLRDVSNGIFLGAVQHTVFKAVPNGVPPITTPLYSLSSVSYFMCLVCSVSLKLDKYRP